MRYLLLFLLIATPAGAKSSAPAVSYTGKNSVPVPTTVYRPPVTNPTTKPYVYRYVKPCGMIKECRK
jgi:hypothetical protein